MSAVKRPQYFAVGAPKPKLSLGSAVQVWDNSYVLQVTPAGLKPGHPAGMMYGPPPLTTLKLIALDCRLPTDSEKSEIVNDAIVVCERTGDTYFVRSSQLKPA